LGELDFARMPVDDALRQNDVVIDGSTVLRIPVVGLRPAPDRLLDQVQRAHTTLSRQAA
jgi:hypothetical protein